jgi:RimJ/RimL family protein N-acetyltransferase
MLKLIKFIQGSEEESMIGDLNLFVKESSVEVNLMVAEKGYRKLGIGMEVVGFVGKFVREVLGLGQVVAKIGENNIASIGLFKKLGFVEYEKNTDFGELHFIKYLGESVN